MAVEVGKQHKKITYPSSPDKSTIEMFKKQITLQMILSLMEKRIYFV